MVHIRTGKTNGGWYGLRGGEGLEESGSRNQHTNTVSSNAWLWFSSIDGFKGCRENQNLGGGGGKICWWFPAIWWLCLRMIFGLQINQSCSLAISGPRVTCVNKCNHHLHLLPQYWWCFYLFFFDSTTRHRRILRLPLLTLLTITTDHPNWVECSKETTGRRTWIQVAEEVCLA